jgi:hypothetical protein
MVLSVLTRRPQLRPTDTHDEDGQDEAERGGDRHRNPGARQHLDADPDQDDGEPALQVGQPADSLGKQEVHRSHAEQGERVGGADDPGVGGHREDGRH